jgi:AraC family transcriptional regulator
MSAHGTLLDLKSGQPRPALDTVPLSVTPAGRWRGLHLEHQRIERFEAADVACPNYVVVLQLERPVTVDFRFEGRWRTSQIRPGQLIVHPAGTPFSSRLGMPSEFVFLSLSPDFFLSAVAPLLDVTRLELPHLSGVDDPLLSGCVRALRDELGRNDAASSLYAESLAGTLAMHLARRYGRAPVVDRSAGVGLTGRALRNVVEYLETHLADDVSLAQLARVAGLSPFHFARQFKISTGATPHGFLRNRRLERARALLQVRGNTLAEVARLTGFCDQSHLSAHFKRRFGLTPGRFVRQHAR